MIGKVGTLFGANGANIANMAVSRTRDGQQALMALSVDEPPSEALIEEMHNVGFGDAIFIDLDVACDGAAMSGRGAGWVVAQFALMAAIIAAGFVPPDWPGEAGRAPRRSALVLIGRGCGFALWAGRALGRALTPFPKPARRASSRAGRSQSSGIPIYLGGLGVFVGYSLLAGVLALVAHGRSGGPLGRQDSGRGAAARGRLRRLRRVPRARAVGG